MRIVLLSLGVLVLLVFAALLWMPLQTGQVNVHVTLPAGSDSNARGTRLVAWARSYDWRGFLAAHLQGQDAERLAGHLVPLTQGLSVVDGQVQGVLSYQVQGADSLVLSGDRLQSGAELVRKRLEVQSWVDAYPELNASDRRRVAWDLYASGFHETIRESLASWSATESDPTLRDFLRELHRRSTAGTAP